MKQIMLIIAIMLFAVIMMAEPAFRENQDSLTSTQLTEIKNILSEAQKVELNELRNLEGYESALYYIYSRGVNKEPELGNVKTFFIEP